MPLDELYIGNNNDLMSLARSQVRQGNLVILGEKPEEQEQKATEEKKSGMSPMTGYKLYKKYSGPSASEASSSGYVDATGSEGYLGGAPEAVESGALTAEEGAVASEGSGGASLGNAASALAYIYAGDQVKKNLGGYEKKGGDWKLDENTHYYKTDEELSEIPWDEKTKMQKTFDAPGTAGGAFPLYIAGQLGGEDSEAGKYYKELARIEKQAFEPISKIISWLGLDIDNGTA